MVNLLQTFATQSALAIHNAQLFREIQAKGRELEAANRHKSEFLANVSHELRTPLNAIIGFSEVLLEKLFGELNDKQNEYVDDILSSGRHLLSLINDILDLSKIEAGHMELELTTFDLPNALDNALVLIRERASRHGVRLERVVDEQLGDFRGDERKIKQVLVNLLSNAVKFTPEGGKIQVRARLRQRRGENLRKRHRHWHRAGASRDYLRGISSGRVRLRTKAGRDRIGSDIDEEVCRDARRQNLGRKRARQRLNVYVYAADELMFFQYEFELGFIVIPVKTGIQELDDQTAGGLYL